MGVGIWSLADPPRDLYTPPTAGCADIDPCRTPCICERLSTPSEEGYARIMLRGSTTLKTAVCYANANVRKKTIPPSNSVAMELLKTFWDCVLHCRMAMNVAAPATTRTATGSADTRAPIFCTGP